MIRKKRNTETRKMEMFHVKKAKRVGVLRRYVNMKRRNVRKRKKLRMRRDVQIREKREQEELGTE